MVTAYQFINWQMWGVIAVQVQPLQYLSWSAAAPVSASVIPGTYHTVLVLKCPWTRISTFILINHSTLCAFSCEFMAGSW